jgi:hypothetical protein
VGLVFAETARCFVEFPKVEEYEGLVKEYGEWAGRLQPK